MSKRESPCISDATDSNEILSQRVQTIIAEIRGGRYAAQGEFRRLLASAVGWLLERHLPARSVEVELPKILDAAIQSVQRGEIRSSADLTHFLQVSAGGGKQAHTIASNNPKARISAVKTALSELQAHEREAMVRFYRGDSSESICDALDISPSELSSLRQKLKNAYAAALEPAVSQGLRGLAARLGTS